MTTAFGPTSGGKVYAYNTLTTTAVQVAPSNPLRQRIKFHNPGAVDIYIAPMFARVSYDDTTPTALTPTTSALGGTQTIYANGGTLEISGECQGGWQALAASGSTGMLTVVDSNV